MVVASFGFAAALFGAPGTSGQSIAAQTFDIAMRSADADNRLGFLHWTVRDLADRRQARMERLVSQDGTDGTDSPSPEAADPDDGEDFARETPAPAPGETQTDGPDGGSQQSSPDPVVPDETQTASQDPSPDPTADTDATDAQVVPEEETSGSDTPGAAVTGDDSPNAPEPNEGTDQDTELAAAEGDTPEAAPETKQETTEQIQGEETGPDTDTEAPAAKDIPEQSGNALSPFDAKAVSGRVTTLDLGDPEIAGIKVLEGPAYGNLTVNPDNTLALVLTGETRTDDISFEIEATFQDGAARTFEPTLEVLQGPQAGGWGLGDFYMLETDADDRIVVEHGEDHRKVHVSGSEEALTLSDIAARESLNTGALTHQFFLDNPRYGATEDMAVSEEVANLIWLAQSSRGVDTSNWMLFERGHEYGGIQGLIASGESALNPIYYGAYGQGADPVLTENLVLIKEGGHNIVFQDIDLAEGVRFLAGSNILLDHVSFGDMLNVQYIDGFTLRHADGLDVVTDAASGEVWDPHKDRISGIYTALSEGILIEDTLFDHNGWEEDYDYHRAAEFGQPPSMFSHNAYLQSSNLDVTFRDNIVMRGAGDGAQVRSGGYIEDNIFIDNNNALMAAAGGQDAKGNYSLFLDNVVTSGAHKQADEGTAGLTHGITNEGYMASLVGNIVTHLSDPNNLAEWMAREIGHHAVKSKVDDPFHDDTIVHNWVGSKNRDRADYDDGNVNTDGLDYKTLDQTTIQIFTAKLLGKPTATIGDLAQHLRAQADGALEGVVDADLIIGFFRKGFGLEVALRDDAQTLRFVPNDLGEGMRWDNRLNWTSETLPGTNPGDDVELAGNWVVYGGTTTIQDLSLGAGGRLTLGHGRLDVAGTLEAGAGGSRILLDNAGQLWARTYEDSDTLRIEAAGGRFVNEGIFRGIADLVVSDDAQAVLATGGGQFALHSGSSLTIRGGAAKLGIDSATDEAAILTLGRDSELRFESEADRLGLVREFHSGAFDSDSNGVRSGIDLGGADLTVDVSALPLTADQYTLLQLDEMIGSFETVRIEGLGSRRDATVTVDYELDAIILALGVDGSGTGQTRLETSGSPDDARTLSPDIWEALIDGQAIWNDPLVSNPDITL